MKLLFGFGWLTLLTLLLSGDDASVRRVDGFLSRSSSTVAYRNRNRMALYANAKPSSSSDHHDDRRALELALLERKVSMLTHQLQQEERRATLARSEWMLERTQLVHKIAGLTTLLKESQQQQQQQQQHQLQEKDDDYEDDHDHDDTVQALTLELTMSRESEQELGQEMDRLEREVKLLQHQIVQIRNLYKTEQYIVQDLEARLEAAEQQRSDERAEWQRVAEAQQRHLESLMLELSQQSMQLLTQQPQQPQQQFMVSSLSSSSSSSNNIKNNNNNNNGYSRRNETLSAASA
jgi:hypothetical protein